RYQQTAPREAEETPREEDHFVHRSAPRLRLGVDGLRVAGARVIRGVVVAIARDLSIPERVNARGGARGSGDRGSARRRRETTRQREVGEVALENRIVLERRGDLAPAQTRGAREQPEISVPATSMTSPAVHGRRA